MTRTIDPLEGIVKVVHSGTCPSMSGKSHISYLIGRHPEGAVHLYVGDSIALQHVRLNGSLKASLATL
jgi:hypothetical protein